jgi:AcrR family transcriptional regulator
MAKKPVRTRRAAGKRAGVSHAGLIQQAADLADREGVAAVTLSRLAAMSGVRTPTVSHHVGNLRLLRSATALLASEELAEAMLRACADRRGADAVRSMYRAYRSFVHAYPGRYAMSLEAPNQADARRMASISRIGEIFVNVFGQIGLRGEDAMRAGRLLRSAVHGYVTLELSAAWQTPLDDEATFNWLLEVIISGLTTVPPAS